MTEKLLPCPNPWCRDNTPKLSQRGGHLYYVLCTGCGIKCEYEHTEDSAVTAWNTRTPDPSVAVLREALEKITKPLVGVPIGDPWAFYADLQKVASDALSSTNPTLSNGEGA